MAFRKKIDRAYSSELFDHLVKQDRIALSKAITLIESQNRSHVSFANDLLEDCLPKSGKSFRIGITGTPGVGKSTFIEALGLLFIARGHKVAVLTIDPSSPKNQGSILGDKSRMEKLSHHKNAYVRSSPAKTTMGGTTDKTRETIILCEAAQYDIIIIETVGVGQSETEIVNMTDLLLLLVLPGAGDEIQGIKRGIVEVADMIIINKKDKFEESIVTESLNTYKFALHLRPAKESEWISNIMSCSAITGEHMDDIFNTLSQYFKHITDNDFIHRNRQRQNEIWLSQKIEQEGLIEIRKRIQSLPGLKSIKDDVKDQKTSINKAANAIINLIFKN